MTRTLQPEDQIAHYRVVGPLGVGGMGEVYIAQDETLERNVALKVLPGKLVKNEERVRRFVTEAKSASSLSHPHIVTIYEIGQDRVKSSDEVESEAGSDPIHYISMELIQGETLQDKIHHEKTDLRTLLGYLAQAAEGLAKAHASGIVHRDLKPSNIMISRDGYAKVLDFGLAKLTERTQSEGEATLAATEVADLTGEGVVLGTVGYMSPEQVRGKTVDHRSDIFSFGCILYEAATRKRPFKSDSDVETMHQILNQQPEAVEELSPEVPNAVRRLIKRCLAKSPERRLHSMKDIAIELADIVEEFDSLAHSGSASSIAEAPIEFRRGMPMPAILAIVALGVAGIAVAVWALTRSGSEPMPGPQPFQTMNMTSVVSAQNVSSPVLSPDGRYLAFVSGAEAERELWVRQVATGSQVKIAGPERVIQSVSFSPDGNYVFFAMRDPETPNYSAIFSVPSLGGSPRKRLFDVDTPISFSPDGNRVCFRRGVPQRNMEHLVIANLDNENEVVRAEIPQAFIVTAPVWSPDGTSIAWSIARVRGGLKATLEIYDVEGGDPRVIALPEAFILGDIDWLPTGDRLVGSGNTIPTGDPQIWSIDAKTGAIERVTNDLNEYSFTSVGANGEAIAAVRRSETSNVWTVGVGGEEPARQITFGGGGTRIGALHSLENGDILCEFRDGDSGSVARMSPDGSNLRMLTGSSTTEFSPIPKRNTVVFIRLDDPVVPHVWSMDLDGRNIRQLTRGAGEVVLELSPDATVVLYSSTSEMGRLWLQPLDGGEAMQIADDITTSSSIEFSRDGRYILCTSLRQLGERWVNHIVVLPVTGGDPIHTIPPPKPGLSVIHWIPGQEAISYQVAGGLGGENLYRIEMDGTGDTQLTDFSEGSIDFHAWSPDGRYLLMDRELRSGVELWVQRFEDGAAFGPARKLASFPSGYLSDMTWLVSQDTIAFRHITTSRDVVLVRDFQ